MATMTAEDCDRFLKQVLLKDLRIQCRARGLSPAGGKEQLSERLRENMIATNDFNMKAEDGSNVPANNTQAGMSTNDMTEGHGVNNYARPSGQNVGNFLTDRSSSRVMAPPGGASSIVFGASEIPGLPSGSRRGAGANAPGSISQGNNYARPGGQQNVGNFLSDRPSSKVMAPPGGASQITFG